MFNKFLIIYFKVLLIASYSVKTLQAGTEKYKTIKVTTATGDWEKTGVCDGITNVNGFQKMCVDELSTSCNLESPINFKDFKGRRLKVEVKNTKAQHDSCGCNDSIKGLLTLVQHPKGGGKQAKSINLSNQLYKIIDVVENIETVVFNFELKKVCWSNIEIRLDYVVCNPQSVDLMNLHQVVAPSSQDRVQNTTVTCAENATKQQQQNPVLKCYTDGTSEVVGECVCAKDYERNGNSCQLCQFDHFKSVIGNGECIKCMIYSKYSNGKCHCIESYARAKVEVDKTNAECFSKSHKYISIPT